MVYILKKIAESQWFAKIITIVIVAAAVLVGLETYKSVMDKHGTIIDNLVQLVLWIFLVEIVIRMGAEGGRPWRYFLDPWNVFDFIIVATAFMAFGGSFVIVLRLVRLLRILKRVRALPRLQLLVSALLRSIPSMGYVSVLLLLFFYIYAVAAVFFFSGNDPVHFPDIQTSMLSLFRAVTLEDWTDLMYINMYGCANYGYDSIISKCDPQAGASALGGAAFFVSFVLVGTMIILNLFIGVIMNAMDEARAEQLEMARADEKGGEVTVYDTVLELRQKLNEINKLMSVVEKMAAREKKGA